MSLGGPLQELLDEGAQASEVRVHLPGEPSAIVPAGGCVIDYLLVPDATGQLQLVHPGEHPEEAA